MQTAYSGASGSGNFTGLSLDGIFLLHFLQALDRLQSYLGEGSGEEETRWMKVNLQFQYLIHLLPRETQVRVNKLVEAKERELKVNREIGGEYAPLYISRMEIVTEVVTYLTNSLDLVHDDIIASLTPRAKEHAVADWEVIDLV